LEVKEFGVHYNVFNVCGPYHDKIAFSEGLEDSRMLNDTNTLVGGDLNLNLSMHEV
jgi:hypothetical protein